VTSRVRKAVFPAAGLGTRFLPATKAQPKEMLPLVDKPIIQYGVEEATASGVDHIIIVTGRGKNAIEDHFDINIELETFLEARGKSAPRPSRSRTCDRANRSASGTPCSARATWSATSRSP
jgi:UTP--glucose-1-phosphate uridylyltransferase